jgi:hypothetical protein
MNRSPPGDVSPPLPLLEYDRMSSTRRTFIKQTSLSVAAAAIGPTILGAEDKAGTKRPRVGDGAFVYECEHDWGAGSLPAGHHYGNASHGVTIDKAGLIYISHYGDPGSIFIFDPHGKFIRAMGD